VWFDSHCHLFDLDDPEAAAVRARAAGVGGALICGTDAATSARAAELAERTGWWAAAGIHPTAMKGWDDAWLDELMPLLDHPRVVAVGETGIDLYRDRSFFADQLVGFATHVRAAKERDLALVIHTRNSVGEALELLERESPPDRLVFHCWSGDLSQLKRALGLGAFVSFAGNVSYKSADALRAAAAAVPASRLLVETDSPYLAPEPRRGRPNEPAFLVHVGETVARARGEEVEAVAEVTAANARALLGLP
jgi:TatD DNase family protein